MTNGKVLVLGEYAPAVRERVGEIIYRAGAERVELADWKVHREQLRQPGVVAAVFPSTLPDLETLCLDVRSELSAEDLPLLVVTPCHWETGLERLFMYSVDDFVTESRLDALEAKLLALGRGNPWTNLNPESGRVVVADPDRSRRILFGRMLRRKGLGVDFAIDKTEVLRLLSERGDVRLVIASTDLPPLGATDVMATCQQGAGPQALVPWVLTGDTETLSDYEHHDGASQTVRLLNQLDPPESLLFLVNDLLSPPPENARRSPRMLYGAPATFRVLGSRHRVPAFTYNVNRTGLFVRTLVPPPRESEISVDFRPPFGEGRVRVYGNVVWRKECTQQGGPVVPAGMGVLFSQVPLADQAGFLAGYDALVEATPSDYLSSSLPPPSDDQN